MLCSLHAGSVETVVETDSYIPLNIRFGEEDFEVDRKGVYGPNGELLEFAVSLSSNEIRELTLVHCEKYERFDTPLLVPTAEVGIVSLEMADHSNVSCFDVCVHPDGLRIKFADSNIGAYLRHGNAAIGVSEDADAIIEVLLYGIDSETIASMIDTIEITASQKDIVITYDGNTEE